MATHRLAPTFSPSTADTQRQQKGGTEDPDHRSAVMLPRAIYTERRCESRMDSRLLCSYEMIEAIEEESVVIEQGKAIALNRSTEGMLLCMRPAPHVMQMIEVRIPCYRWCRTATVFDVRWIRSVHMESFGHLYLVGCRRVFGPCHYLSF
jgi:hypothetical protein